MTAGFPVDRSGRRKRPFCLAHDRRALRRARRHLPGGVRGDTFAAAMRQSGHDGYWPVYMLLVGVAGATLVASTALRVARLRLRLAALGTPHRGRSPWGCRIGSAVRLTGASSWSCGSGSSPRSSSAMSSRRTWSRSLTTTCPALGVRRPDNPLALPALAAITFILAAVGALVRWRIAILGDGSRQPSLPVPIAAAGGQPCRRGPGLPRPFRPRLDHRRQEPGRARQRCPRRLTVPSPGRCDVAFGRRVAVATPSSRTRRGCRCCPRMPFVAGWRLPSRCSCSCSPPLPSWPTKAARSPATRSRSASSTSRCTSAGGAAWSSS